jgi:DNA-binding response OmpR family regulator
MSDSDSPKTILIIDDEEMIREIAHDMLSHLGYNIILAADGEEAIEIFRKNYQSIDMVLVDLIMPKMNGAVCLQKLKEINKETPIIVASGITEVSKKKSVLEMGAHDYLEKPYSIKSLKEICLSVFNPEDSAN